MIKYSRRTDTNRDLAPTRTPSQIAAQGPAPSSEAVQAGAESFASGLFTRFDITFLVVEPTRKSLQVFRQWSSYAADYQVPLAVIGNKTQGDEDAFLRDHAGENLLTCFPHLPGLRAMEQGRPFSLGDTGPQARDGLALLQHAVDAQVKDWAAFIRQAAHFHLKNARAWANTATGEDLTAQIDPDFIPSFALPTPVS
jgi:CO dehydrogenase maturation factor